MLNHEVLLLVEIFTISDKPFMQCLELILRNGKAIPQLSVFIVIMHVMTVVVKSCHSDAALVFYTLGHEVLLNAAVFALSNDNIIIP